MNYWYIILNISASHVGQLKHLPFLSMEQSPCLLTYEYYS